MTITLCIPVYNGQRFITECLESILNQDVDGLHILISDNASTDKTVQQVLELADSRVELFQQPHNIGLQSNINWLLDHAEGDVVGTFCADDVMLPGHLRHQLAEMQRFPQARLYSCEWVVTDHKLENRTRVHLPGGLRRGSDLTQLSLRTVTNLYGGPSNFLWRGSQMTARYDPSYRYLSDFKFAHDAVADGLFYNTARAGYLYRRHDMSETNLSCPPELQLQEWRRFFGETGIEGPLSTLRSPQPGSDTLSRIRRRIACSPLNTRVRRARDLFR